MSAPDAMRCFETLVKRMEGAVAIDAWLLGLGDEGALLAERLATQLRARLPSKHSHAALDLHALAQGELRTVPGAALSEILSFSLPPCERGCPEGAGEGGDGSPFLQGEGWSGDGLSAPSPPAPLPRGERGIKCGIPLQGNTLLNQDRPKGATIILVDAVLWRGETIVQAVSLLRRHGVHAPIELAVLADRGGYLVPVAPTYCGGEIIVAEDTVLRLVVDGGALRFNEASVIA